MNIIIIVQSAIIYITPIVNFSQKGVNFMGREPISINVSTKNSTTTKNGEGIKKIYFAQPLTVMPISSRTILNNY